MSDRDLIRAFRIAILCALVGAGLALAGFFIAPERFFPAWLAAYYYCLSLPLGATTLLLAHDLTGGRWELVARAPLEAAAATMPFFVLGFLPIIAGLHTLYGWTEGGHAATFANHWYLNLDFFSVRAAIYLLVWNFFAFFALRPGRAPAISGIGLILFAFTATFASIDWLMSIEPDWFSSIYGMMVGAGQFVVALSFILLVAILRPAAVGMTQFRRHLATLVTLLLAVDIFWAYAAYSQWLIIWEENLHSEIPWYIERLRGDWRPLVLIIVLAHIVVPLFTLVWTPTKKMPRLVAAIAVILLLADLLQFWWLVLPQFERGLSWIAPATAIGLGGAWLALFLWRLERAEQIVATALAKPSEAKS